MKSLRNLSKRQVLAVKIFLTLLIVNTLLFSLVAPAEDAAEEKFEKNSTEIEIKIKGELHTSFEEGKELTLLHSSGKKIGPARLVRVEEDSITLYLEKSLFAKSYVLLSQSDWVLIPYIALPTFKGSSYEIHY